MVIADPRLDIHLNQLCASIIPTSSSPRQRRYPSVSAMPLFNLPSPRHFCCEDTRSLPVVARAHSIKARSSTRGAAMDRAAPTALGGDDFTLSAGSSVFTEEELAELVELEDHIKALRLDRGSAPRRSRSASPSRRSPKLRHTNGRLEPSGAGDENQQPPRTETRGRDSDVWDELARLSTAVATEDYDDAEEDEDEAFLSGDAEIPSRQDITRSVTGMTPDRRARLLRVFGRNDSFRELCAQNTRRIIATAKASESNNGEDENAASASNEAGGVKPTPLQRKLALKALKYRKLLAPANRLDEKHLEDPNFDVLEYIAWCKA